MDFADRPGSNADAGNGNGDGNSADSGRVRPGLNLDARQRAMLEEMGVRVWWPAAAGATGAADSATAEDAAARPAGASPPAPHAARRPPPGTPRHPAADSAAAAPAPRAATPAPAARPSPAPATATATATATNAAQATGAWRLQAPQPLFPDADPRHTPAALGAGWLVVVEGRAGSNPLAGDAGRLLENMLRALRLHHHPRAFVCLLDAQPPGNAPGAPGAPGPADDGPTLESALAAVQPAVLLLLGRTVARVLLGRSDPFGRLRAEPLQVAGVPAVVSYDAPYLLRAAPETKALVWADLCRARALAGAAPGTQGTSPHA